MKNSNHNNLVSGIDIGSEKIYCAIGLRFPETSKVKLLGIGISPVNESFKKGTISNRNKLINQIEIAVNEAEIMADQKINNAYISLTGDHIKSMNTQSAIALNRNNNIDNNSISQKDINRVLELTQGIALPPDRDILHTIPQEFIVDTLEKIANPVGLSGRRLEGHVHLVTAARTAMKNLVESTEEIGIKVNGLVLKPLAAASSSLTKDEIELGVSLIDIGATTTGIAVFKEGAIRHSAIIPIGSQNITNDIAVMLRTSINTAENIKIKYSSAKASLSSPNLDFKISDSEDTEDRNISEYKLSEYVEARMEEIFQLSRKEINRAGLNDALTYGLVLTGGGAQLRNVSALAKDFFSAPVRIGKPIIKIEGNKNFIDKPINATVLGLLIWPYIYHNQHSIHEKNVFSLFNNIKQLIKDFF